MNKKSKTRNIILTVLLVIFVIFRLISYFSEVDDSINDNHVQESEYSADVNDFLKEIEESDAELEEENAQDISDIVDIQPDIETESSTESWTIDKLTAEDYVVEYVRENKRLPDFYITKNEARKLGWQSTYRDLCDAAPGKAIGGDYFGDFEGNLPKKKGRKYYEADLNYKCGKRNADRLVYSNDGLIFVTKDHYKTYQER